MKFVVEIEVDPDDTAQGGSVAEWLDLIATSVRNKRKFSIFQKKIEGDSIWKVLP